MSIKYAVQQEMAILFGEETVAEGTEAGALDLQIGAESLGSPRSPFDAMKSRVGGGGRNYYHQLSGAQHIGSEVDFLLQNGLPFYWALGKCVDSGTYLHTITIEAPIPSLSMEFIADDLSYSIKHLGCKMNELKMVATVNDIVKCNASFVGMSVEKELTPTALPTPLATSPFTFEHGSLTVDSVSYADRIKAFEFGYNNGLVEGHTLGGLNPAYVSEGGSEITGSIEVVVVDDTELDLLLNESEVGMTFLLERTSSTDDLTIEADKVRFFEYDQPFDMDGEEIRAVLPFSIAREDLDVLVNDAIATYPV